MAEFEDEETPEYKCDNDSKPIDLNNCLIVSRAKTGAEPQQWIFENEHCLAEFILPQDTPLIFKEERLRILEQAIKEAF